MPDSSAVILTRFTGRAGDHNDRAMSGSGRLADALAARLDQEAMTIGAPQPARSVGWVEELAAAMPDLSAMAAHYDRLYASGRTPETTATGFLDGMALSGPLGWWNSGLGSGLGADRVIMVGTREIDPPERTILNAGTVAWVLVGDDLPERLRSAVAGRPVYVHLDCDVLEPGLVPTDYRVAGGLDLDQLRVALEVLAEDEVVGVEVGEFESGPDDRTAAVRLVDALQPVITR